MNSLTPLRTVREFIGQPRPLPDNSYARLRRAWPPWPLRFPADVLRAYFTWPRGYELVRPVPAILRALALLYLPPCFWDVYAMLGGRPPYPLGHEWLEALALGALALDLTIFARRFIGQHRAEQVHSFNAGWSVVARATRLPVFFTEVIFAPCLVAVLGLQMRNVSAELSYFMLWGGVSLFMMALWEHFGRLAALRALRDAMINNDSAGQRYEQYEAHIRPRPGASGHKPDFADLS